MRIYFICLHGNVRSKAAAKQFKLRAKKDRLELITDYARVISNEGEKKPKQELIDNLI
jgi:protein-tyrosine-phosphatase